MSRIETACFFSEPRNNDNKNTPLFNLLNFNDLGIIFDSKLNLLYYIEFIKKKSMRIYGLGLIGRSYKDFYNPFALKIL